MTKMFNPSRLGATLLLGLIALTPVIALAQAQQNPPPATPQSPPAPATQAGPGMGQGMMEHGMMEHGMKMEEDKKESGMGGQMGGTAMPHGQGTAPPSGASPPMK